MCACVFMPCSTGLVSACPTLFGTTWDVQYVVVFRIIICDPTCVVSATSTFLAVCGKKLTDTPTLAGASLPDCIADGNLFPAILRGPRPPFWCTMISHHRLGSTPWSCSLCVTATSGVTRSMRWISWLGRRAATTTTTATRNSSHSGGFYDKYGGENEG